MDRNTEQHGDVTVRVFRYGFGPGFYAEAKGPDGKRLAFTGVFRGPGSRRRAIDAALSEARTGQFAKGDVGCTG